MIVASFASHIHRVQQAITIAHLHGRKFAVSGRSMVKNVNIARNLGYLKVPDGAMIKLTEIDDYRPEELLILSTGSQGEPLSALTRMAFDDHPQVELHEGDTVVISAKPIPGNERQRDGHRQPAAQVGRHGDLRRATAACTSAATPSQEDLRMMLNLAAPAVLRAGPRRVPHQHLHAELARESGIADEDIFILENGDVLELDGDNGEIVDKVPTGMVFVDGFEIGDAEGLVLRDRQQLAGDGILIAVVTVDAQTGDSVAPPELVARGFLHDDERLQDVLDECGEALDELMDELGAEHVTGQRLIREDINERSPSSSTAHQAAAAHHAGRRRGLSGGAGSWRRRAPRDSRPRVEQTPYGDCTPEAGTPARGRRVADATARRAPAPPARAEAPATRHRRELAAIACVARRRVPRLRPLPGLGRRLAGPLARRRRPLAGRPARLRRCRCCSCFAAYVLVARRGAAGRAAGVTLGHRADRRRRSCSPRRPTPSASSPASARTRSSATPT